MNRITVCGCLVTGIAILALLATAGCTTTNPHPQTETGQTEILVFCAASLSGAMTDIAREYEATHPGTKIILNTDSSQALYTQIRQGARADLFLSASTKQMNALQGEGQIRNDSVRIFARNRLALIIPKDNSAGITGIRDLSRPGIRLVIGTKEVPFGDYTRQALGKLAADPGYGQAYRDGVMANVISEEPTVPSLVAKIRLVEADAGIAYASDISVNDRAILTTIPIPDQYNVIATYPLGIVQDSAIPDRAAKFSEFIVSPKGSAILTRYGFIPTDS